MLYNRYHGDYESDFQYYLRREINNPIPSYKAVYITPSGEWYYNEPSSDYILVHVDSRFTISSIDAVAREFMNQFTYPF